MIAALMFAAALSGSTPAVIHTTQVNEAALAEAQAFARIMEPMVQEMRDAINAAGADTDQRKADLDAIEASYMAQVDAFGTKMVAHFGVDAMGIMIAESRARVSTIRARLEANPSMNPIAPPGGEDP
jgi:hypothetical protein